VSPRTALPARAPDGRWMPARAPDGRWTVDAWAPLDGFVANGGVRVAF